MEVSVTQTVTVEVPDGYFSEEFMEEFRKSFYDFYTPSEHFKHLAQLYARGLVGYQSFIEGYGLANVEGLKFEVSDITADILEGTVS